MGYLPPWLAWIFWVVIGVGIAVLLLTFWWQGTLGNFFQGLSAVPTVR